MRLEPSSDRSYWILRVNPVNPCGIEGDLIRPLGHVTLYFGYAEAGVDALLVGIGGRRTYRGHSAKYPTRPKARGAA